MIASQYRWLIIRFISSAIVEMYCPRWGNHYPLHFFDWHNIAPVEVDCVDDAWSLQMWDVAHCGSVFSDFLTATVNISNIWVDADYVIPVIVHEHS